MAWGVPEWVRLKMVHELDVKQEPGLIRSRVRETSVVVRRPADGEAHFPVECGYCHRKGVFVVQDLATTKELRRRPTIQSPIWSVILIATVIVFAVLGFGGGSILFQVLTIPAGLMFLPFGIMLAVSPSGKLGVSLPEAVTFESRTKREGFSYVTRNVRHREGVSCVGIAMPAKVEGG